MKTKEEIEMELKAIMEEEKREALLRKLKKKKFERSFVRKAWKYLNG